MKLSLTYRFTLYVGGILLAGVCALILYDLSYHPRLMERFGRAEAERLALVVFDQLHTSMRLGGGRAENRAIAERVSGVEGVEEVRLIHGESVDRQYGIEEDELPVDEYDRRALGGVAAGGIVSAGGEGADVLRYTRPFLVEESCTGCHNARVGEVAGAISVTLSLEGYEAAMGTHTRQLLLWGLAILLVTTMAAAVATRRRLRDPLQRLRRGVGELASGRLSTKVAVRTGDELEEVGKAFDEMAESLNRTTTELRALGEKHSRLVEMAADGILLKDLETGRFADANPAAATLTGYPREDLVGMDSEKLYPREKLDEYRRTFSRWVHDGRGYLHDATIVRKDGQTASVEIAGSLLELDGRLYIQEVWRDLSERKGFEKAIKRYVARLEDTVAERTARLNRSLNELEEAYGKLKSSEQRLIQSAKYVSLGEMGAGIAHELNSPLAGILSITEVLLSRTTEGDRNRRLLEKIKDAAVRSKYIILDVLTYSRPTTGELEPMFINESIRASLCMFVSELKSSSIEIVEDFDPELPRAMGNKGRIMEVILNIIKNARDAMGGEGRIYITTRRVDDEGRDMDMVEIRDTGPGVPEEVRDKIFDPFFSTKEKGGGHNIGLGLSIAQGIMKEHGGRIEVENAPEGGAAFRVFIPVATSEEAGGPATGDGRTEPASEEGKGAEYGR